MYLFIYSLNIRIPALSPLRLPLTVNTLISLLFSSERVETTPGDPPPNPDTSSIFWASLVLCPLPLRTEKAAQLGTEFPVMQEL